MRDIKVFENVEFGELEILMIDGKEYFPATQCATILGYSNPHDAIVRHCKVDGVVKHEGVSSHINQHGRRAIQAKQEALSSAKIATAREIQEYLTSVMRGESRSSVVVMETCGDGATKAKIIEKLPDDKERLRAAELLGKRYGLYTHKVEVESKTPIVIKEDLDD